MQLITLGLNHQSAPLQLRERLAFPGDALRDGLNELRASLKGFAPEQALLSTCNRTEMYLAVEHSSQARGQAMDWLAWKSGTPESELSHMCISCPMTGQCGMRFAWPAGWTHGAG